VHDAQPRMPETLGDVKWPGSLGDYVSVYGGKSIYNGKVALQIRKAWNKIPLWKKKQLKKTNYLEWPGILTKDWEAFNKDMAPEDLKKLNTFLIERQHICHKNSSKAKELDRKHEAFKTKNIKQGKR
jgi:hypothetical protein